MANPSRPSEDSTSPASFEHRAYRLEDFYEGSILIVLQSLLRDTGYSMIPYPEYPEPPALGIGWYTFPGKRVIFFNPHHLENRDPYYGLMITAHEIGHHDPELVVFQEACTKMNAAYSHLFANNLPVSKLFSSLDNISADIFLEARNSRGMYNEFMWAGYCKALAEDMLPMHVLMAHDGPFTPENFPWEAAVPKAASLLETSMVPLTSYFQNGILLMAKFGKPPSGLYPPKVEEALEKAYPHILVMGDVDKSRVGLSHRMHAQVQLYGILADLANEDYGKMEELSKESDEKADCDKCDLKDLLDAFEQMLDAQIESTEPKSQETTDPNAPTVPGSEEGEGGEKGKGAGAGEGDGSVEQVLSQMGKGIRAAMSQLVSGLISNQASQLGVPPEDLKNYLEYVNRHSALIELLSQTLIEILLDEREPQITGGHRHGFMVEPGMGAQAYLESISGDPFPPYQLSETIQVNPLRMQAAIALDTSGSMLVYEKGMLGLLATLMESIRRIHEEIQANPARYNFDLGRDAMPAQLELSTFADGPELILPMSTVLDLKESVTRFNEMQRRGGGTDTHSILEFEYDRLTAYQDDQIVRVLTLITDALDGGEALDNIVRKITNDPRIYFMILGVGDGDDVEQYIDQTYRKHLKPEARYRFFAQGFDRIELALLAVINFFKRTLQEERHKRNLMLREFGRIN